MHSDSSATAPSGNPESGKIAGRGNGSSPRTDQFEVMGLQLHNLHRFDIVDRVVAASLAREKYLVVNANAHCVTLSQKETWLRDMFREADIAFCDGAGVQLATKFLKGFVPHRTTPPEWIDAVLERLGPKARVFWIGGAPEVVAEAAQNFANRFNVVTVGTQHGYFDAHVDSAESRSLVARINESEPTLLLVNMGMPRQERWLWENWPHIRTGVAITAGALVDHAAERVSRPPRWVANLGVEWLVRLCREPGRLWRRYLLGLPAFGAHVIRYAIQMRLPQPSTGRS
jgi:N-acetylglucosaminyldiphosphoundecaprenol N-acetyl-beta-D-mannosaminyltransferase